MIRCSVFDDLKRYNQVKWDEAYFVILPTKIVKIEGSWPSSTITKLLLENGMKGGVVISGYSQTAKIVKLIKDYDYDPDDYPNMIDVWTVECIAEIKLY